MPSSWPAMLNLGAVVCLGGGVLIFPLWRRLLGKWIDKRQALLLSNTMVYLTPDESFSTNAQVPAANPIAGTENYSIGEKKRTRTAQHSRKKRPVKQSEREVFGLHMVCPNSSNVFFLNRIIMPCLFWQFTLHVWVTRCLFQSFIISKLKYLYIVYICTDVCREDHVYAYACTAIKHPWVHFFRKETPKKSLPFFILRCLPGSKNRGYPPGIRCRSLVNSDARKKAGWKHHGTWTVLKVLILWPYMLYNYIYMYIISNEI